MGRIINITNSKFDRQMEVYEKFFEPFDKGYAELRRKGFKLATAQELVEARIIAGTRKDYVKEEEEEESQENYDIKSVLRVSTWIAEGVIYSPKYLDEILMVDGAHNPILKHYRKATEAHREGRRYFIGKKIFEKLRDIANSNAYTATKTGVFLLSRELLKEDIRWVSTKYFVEDPLLFFLLREQTSDYGKLLRRMSIESIPIYFSPEERVVVNEQNQKKQPYCNLIRVNDVVSCGGYDMSGSILWPNVRGGFDCCGSHRLTYEGGGQALFGTRI